MGRRLSSRRQLLVQLSGRRPVQRTGAGRLQRARPGLGGVTVPSPPPPPPPPTNMPPYANFSWTPASGATSIVFTFTSTSFDAQDPPNLLQVRWDWESDGTWDTPWSNDATAQHQFAVPGTYNVTMEVKDTGGLTGNQTATVIVTPTPPPPPPST